MRKNTCTWGHVTRFRTSLRLRLITMRESCLSTIEWPRYLLPSFPKWECCMDTLRLFPNKWYYFPFERWVRGMHHCEHDWFELCKSWWLVLLNVCWTDGLLRMIMVIVIVFLLIIVIWCIIDFFYNKLTLVILYCVVGTYDDCETLFVGVNEQQ